MNWRVGVSCRVGELERNRVIEFLDNLKLINHEKITTFYFFSFFFKCFFPRKDY